MNERKILVEVTKEELEKIENGLQTTFEDVVAFLKQRCVNTASYNNAMTGRDKYIHHGSIEKGRIKIEFTICEDE